MDWADLSTEAKSILEWVEHIWTGKRQVLKIERGKTWIQLDDHDEDVVIAVTDDLFKEIRAWLPYSTDTIHSVDEDTITVTLKNGVRLH